MAKQHAHLVIISCSSSKEYMWRRRAFARSIGLLPYIVAHLWWRNIITRHSRSFEIEPDLFKENLVEEVKAQSHTWVALYHGFLNREIIEVHLKIVSTYEYTESRSLNTFHSMMSVERGTNCMLEFHWQRIWLRNHRQSIYATVGRTHYIRLMRHNRWCTLYSTCAKERRLGVE